MYLKKIFLGEALFLRSFNCSPPFSPLKTYLSLRKIVLALGLSKHPVKRDPAEGGDGDGIRRIMCPSVTKGNKGENQRIINQSFHDVTRCVSFYVSKKKNPRRKRKTRKNNTRSHTRTHTFNRRAKKAKSSKSIKKNTKGKNRTRKERKVSFCMSLTDTTQGKCGNGEMQEEEG